MNSSLKIKTCSFILKFCRLQYFLLIFEILQYLNPLLALPGLRVLSLANWHTVGRFSENRQMESKLESMGHVISGLANSCPNLNSLKLNCRCFFAHRNEIFDISVFKRLIEFELKGHSFHSFRFPNSLKRLNLTHQLIGDGSAEFAKSFQFFKNFSNLENFVFYPTSHQFHLNRNFNDLSTFFETHLQDILPAIGSMITVLYMERFTKSIIELIAHNCTNLTALT